VKPGDRSRLRLVPDAPPPAPGRTREDARASHPAQGGRRRPLLYVGAEVDSRIVVTRIARRWQALKVLAAPTGRAGLRIASERRLGIVVMHAALPDVDALELMGAIRTRGLSPSVPVVVIAHEGSPTERARFLWAGASAYIPTPLRVAEVDQAVGMLLEAAAVR